MILVYSKPFNEKKPLHHIRESSNSLSLKSLWSPHFIKHTIDLNNFESFLKSEHKLLAQKGSYLDIIHESCFLKLSLKYRNKSLLVKCQTKNDKGECIFLFGFIGSPIDLKKEFNYLLVGSSIIDLSSTSNINLTFCKYKPYYKDNISSQQYLISETDQEHIIRIIPKIPPSKLVGLDVSFSPLLCTAQKLILNNNIFNIKKDVFYPWLSESDKHIFFLLLGSRGFKN